MQFAIRHAVPPITSRYLVVWSSISVNPRIHDASRDMKCRTRYIPSLLGLKIPLHSPYLINADRLIPRHSTSKATGNEPTGRRWHRRYVAGEKRVVGVGREESGRSVVRVKWGRHDHNSLGIRSEMVGSGVGRFCVAPAVRPLAAEVEAGLGIPIWKEGGLH